MLKILKSLHKYVIILLYYYLFILLSGENMIRNKEFLFNWYDKEKNCLDWSKLFSNKLRLNKQPLSIPKDINNYELRVALIEDVGRTLQEFYTNETIINYTYKMINNDSKNLAKDFKKLTINLNFYSEDFELHEMDLKNNKIVIPKWLKKGVERNSFNKLQKRVKANISNIFEKILDIDANFYYIRNQIYSMRKLLNLEIKRLLPLFRFLTHSYFNASLDWGTKLLSVSNIASYKSYDSNLTHLRNNMMLFADIYSTIESNKYYYRDSILRRIKFNFCEEV